MRVLVTGAAGFVGAHLVRRLRERHEVFAVARRPPAGEEAEGVRWLIRDLTEPLDPAGLPERIDGVAHLAQSDRYRDLPAGAADVFAVNVAATFRLLEYARTASATRFVLASTGGLYQRSDAPITESDPVRPADLYFRSKHLAEQLLEQYSEWLRCASLRLFFPYGPGPSKMLVSRLVARVRAGEEITIEGQRGLALNPVFVGDVAGAFERALTGEADGVFNLAGSEPTTLADLIALIGAACGREPVLRHSGGDPEGGLVGDISRLRAELGFSPATPLREGIAAMVAAPSSVRGGAPAR